MFSALRTPFESVRNVVRRLRGDVEPPHVVVEEIPPVVVVAPAVVEEEFDPARVPPTVLFLTTSMGNLCNFRCKHCHIWMNEDSRNELTTEKRVDVIEQFATAIRGRGTVILAGGEVTMDLDELFAIAGACRDHALQCYMTTNGSAVTPEVADQIVASGITWVTVSLDSHRPEIHEYTRGMRGCFEQTVNAIRLLVDARTRAGVSMTVAASCVVFDQNVDELEDYVEYCRALGADAVDLQLLSRTFSNQNPKGDTFFENHFWWTADTKENAKKKVESVVNRYADDPLVLKNPDDLPWMLSYIDDPDFRTSAAVCASHERNLVVDTTGAVSLCFSAEMIFDEPAIGNVRDSTLAELWVGARAQSYRAVMNECRLNCGALNCHRRTNIWSAVSTN